MPDEFRTILPDARVQPRFAGISTFCRFPPIDDVARAGRPVDWAVYGIPFDGGVTFQAGARFGPRAIREASQYIKPYNPALDVDIARRLALVDAGDAPVKPYSCYETLQVASAWAAQLGEPGRTRLLAVGGDHSIAYANIRATWERRGRPAGGLAMIHFDAHLDTAPAVWGEEWTHASPFRHAIEEGLIDASRMISLGIRGPLNTPDDLSYGREKGIDIVTFEDWDEGDGAERLEGFLHRLGAEEVYLTFDIDCVDPAFAPGTGTPCSGGFTAADALRLLRSLHGVNLAGADVVEVLPARDPSGVTSLLASHVIFELLSLAALNV